MTKDKIISAAIEEFAEHGYHEATIRNICRRAGVNIAAINYHFSGKAELYRRSLAMLFARKPPLPGGDGIDSDAALKAVMREWVKTFLYRGSSQSPENQPLRKIAHYEMLNHSGIFEEIVELYLKPELISLESIVRQGLPPDCGVPEVKIRAFAIIGACKFYFFNNCLLEKILPDGNFLERNLEKIASHIAGQGLAGLKFTGGRAGQEAQRDI